MFRVLFFLVVAVFLVVVLFGRRGRTYPYEGLPIYNNFITKTLNGQLLVTDSTDNIEVEENSSQVTPPITKPSNESKGEASTRAVMESIFKVPFVKVRPSWLINPDTGARMELDGYNEELGIAFEYNGQQEVDTFPGTTTKKHANQIYRDLLKPELCYQKDVYLFNVPYWVENKRAHIINQMYPEMRAKYS